MKLIIGLLLSIAIQISAVQSKLLTRRADVGFALDRHESIVNATWQSVLAFVADVGVAMDIETTRSRLGIVSFDEMGIVDIELDDHNNTAQLLDDILGQPPGGAKRAISAGLYRLRVGLFVREHGDKLGGLDNVAVLITNGDSDHSWAIHEAELLREAGTTIFAIGVGPDVDPELLADICGTDGRIYMIDHFSELSTMTDILIDDIQYIVTPPPIPALSDMPVDVCVVVDRHESINMTSWQQMLLFVAEFAWLLNIDDGLNRVGLVSFDTISSLDIALNKHTDDYTIYQDIMNQPHDPDAGQAIDLGLRRTRTDCFHQDNGGRTDVHNLTVLITNGDADAFWTTYEATLLRKTGATILAIGVGSNINYRLLLNITCPGDESRIYHVDDFAELSQNPDLILATLMPSQLETCPSDIKHSPSSNLTLILCVSILSVVVIITAVVAAAMLCKMSQRRKIASAGKSTDVPPTYVEATADDVVKNPKDSTIPTVSGLVAKTGETPSTPVTTDALHFDEIPGVE